MDKRSSAKLTLIDIDNIDVTELLIENETEECAALSPPRTTSHVDRISSSAERPVSSTPKFVSLDNSSILYSLRATPLRPYSERCNSAKVVANYGDAHTTDWIASRELEKDKIAKWIRNAKETPVFDGSYCFMNQGLRSIIRALDSRLNWMTERMRSAFPIITEQTMDAENYKEKMVYACGMIFNADDTDRDTRLRPENICLRGPESVSKSMLVDVTELPEYSLFSGQVVCIRGRQAEGGKLIAETMWPGCLPSSAQLDMDTLGALDRMSIVISAGPFTSADGFGYEPLEVLLNYVQQHQPHVLILIGPVVPMNRSDILTLPTAWNAFYNQIMNQIIDACTQSGTQLVMVSSAEDAAWHACYPTPPSRITSTIGKGSALFVSDPCLINVGGLLFGITATDVLKHLSSDEIFKMGDGQIGSDRMTRLIRHILLQQTFWPIFPPAEGVSIDMDAWNTYAKLPVRPHLLVLPSCLKTFVKDVENVLVVNPGHLAKGNSAGSFCRLEFDGRKLAHECGEPLRCIRAQIVRI